jgi:hypothetical protein
MEKSESGPLKFFGTLAVIVIILSILFINKCVNQYNLRNSMGRAWCESIISGYEADREKFLEVHSDRLPGGSLFLKPSPEYKGASGVFIVERNGEYFCRYRSIGLHGHEYSSKTREWIYLD